VQLHRDLIIALASLAGTPDVGFRDFYEEVPEGFMNN
jgi:hypothetical protein